MALQIPFDDRTDTEALPAAYARIVELALNDADLVGRVTVAVYRSAEARKAGRAPVGHLGFAIPTQAIPEQPEQRDLRGHVTRPAVPRFPGYAELMDAALLPQGTPAGTPLRDLLKGFVYSLLKTRPEFAGALDV